MADKTEGSGEQSSFRPREPEKLAAAVSGIWEKFRGTTLFRVSTLEDAAIAMLEGQLSTEARRKAEREAHKLAGSVGTFGFARASEIAREAETILLGDEPFDQGEVLRFSEITVTLRRELEQPAQVDVPPDARTCLLVIDSDEEFSERVQMEAEGRGLQVRIANTLTDARAALATWNPDVVMLDPFVSGSSEAGINLLAEMTTRVPTRPVIVASQSAAFANRIEAARFGAHCFLQKPIKPALAVESAQQALQSVEVSGSVLVVDDDQQVLEMLKSLLEPRGLQVTTLDDPRAFWDLLENVRPDLIVLDLDMPHVNGVELCRVVRNDSRWGTLPIIFLTARRDPETVRRIFASGADDYVAKPFVGPELTTRIENRLERVRLYQLLADTDPLTGLANRRKAEENISQLIAVAGRQKQPLSVAVVDLDHFKQINDRYGHAVGDEVLRGVAKRLRQTFRGEDVVCRWGGEEFVVGAFGAEKGVLARRLGEAQQALRAESTPNEQGSPVVTMSAGVSEFPLDGADLTQLYKVADDCMYRAKSLGRDRVVSSPSPGGSDGSEHVDIVLVDDDPVLAELLLHAFRTHGFQSVWLQDGEAALEGLGGSSPRLRARVILLDVNLPGRDGLGVLQELARSGITEHSRLIMLTVRSTEQEVVRSLELGAFDHISKPFSVPVLLRRIHTALQSG